MLSTFLNYSEERAFPSFLLPPSLTLRPPFFPLKLPHPHPHPPCSCLPLCDFYFFNMISSGLLWTAAKIYSLPDLGFFFPNLIKYAKQKVQPDVMTHACDLSTRETVVQEDPILGCHPTSPPPPPKGAVCAGVAGGFLTLPAS